MGLISRVSSRTYRKMSQFDAAGFVQKCVDSAKVVIFSATYCPYCRVAQKQFDKLNQTTKKLELDDCVRNKEFTSGDFRDIMSYLSSVTDEQKTIPKVFVCGKYIGGGTETKQLFLSGELQKKLDACEKTYDQ